MCSDSKRLWRKPDFMNASSSFPSSFLDPSRAESMLGSGGGGRGLPPNPFLPFSPMDLSRLSSGGRGEELYEEERSNDLVISSTSSNSNNSLLNGTGPHHHPHPQTPSAAVLSDFAESTMKELLGLYGIAQNLHQGKHKPFDCHLVPRSSFLPLTPFLQNKSRCTTSPDIMLPHTQLSSSSTVYNIMYVTLPISSPVLIIWLWHSLPFLLGGGEGLFFILGRRGRSLLVSMYT